MANNAVLVRRVRLDQGENLSVTFVFLLEGATAAPLDD
jgi:hypothetical protein